MRRHWKQATMAMMLCLTFSAGASQAADDDLIRKIDSLFIIASSAELKYRDLVTPAVDSIAALGVEAVPHLIEKMGTTDARERVALESIFKKIGTPAVPFLNQALLETDSLQLSRVAMMLYYNPDSSSIDNLMQVTRNPFYWVRYESIRALGAIGHHRGTPAVREAFRDGNELVRTAAAVSAGRLNDTLLLPDLLTALNDDYYGVRMTAYEALTACSCAVKTAVMTTALASSTGIVRNYILAVMAGDSCRYDVTVLKQYYADADPVTRSLALRAAFKSAPQAVAAYLSAMSEPITDLLFRQTVEELTAAYEKTKAANP
jgi:HEAT repeat protein